MPVNKSSNRPVLIVTCGLMGTGKSTIAASLSKRLGISLLRSDVVRKELAGLKREEHRYESFGGGIYSKEFFDATYDTLLEKASNLLEKGRGAIIDASFKKRKYRVKAREVASKYNIPFLLIECVCSDEEIKKRLNGRFKARRDISDGRWEIYEDQRRDFEEVTELPDEEHLILDTEKEIEFNIGRAIGRVNRFI